MAVDGGDGVDVGNISGYVKDLIQGGFSATAGLAAFREAGGAVRDSRWYSLYGQITDTIAREPAFLALNPYALPDVADYGTWAMGRGGQYATQVQLQLLDRGTGLMTTAIADYVTDDPHTPAEAQLAVMDQWSDPEAMSTYGVTVLGAIATKVWKTVPYGTQ